MRLVCWAAVAVACLSIGSGSAEAATLRPIGDFDLPIYVTSSPQDPDRLLVAERKGTIVEVAPEGRRQLADLSSVIACCESERGLLSIAPAPDFAGSGRIYVAYTGTPAAGGAEGDIHVDSFRPDPANPDAFLREPIISVEHADEPNHNGGQIQFGPDGLLYVSLGDGGGIGDPFGNGQDTEELLGKLLRIEPRPGQTPSYASPAGNPFAGGPGRDEIWASGLRNPWRFSFDRETGDLVIGDVGQGAREEVDLALSPAAGTVGGGGANYGWNCREGLIPYSAPSQPCGPASSFVDPVFDYVHENSAPGAAQGCSIIGGYVVRDRSLPELYGRYLYADFCVGELRSLVLPPSGTGSASGDRSEGQLVPTPRSFGEDSCGRLYVAAGNGTVYRLEGASGGRCGTGGAPVAADDAPGPLPSTKSVMRPERPRLSLRARRFGRWLKIVARVSPCAGRSGETVVLHRGGRKVGARRLGNGCVVRFRQRVETRATFRALLLGDLTLRSGRLTVPPVGPDSGH